MARIPRLLPSSLSDMDEMSTAAPINMNNAGCIPVRPASRIPFNMRGPDQTNFNNLEHISQDPSLSFFHILDAVNAPTMTAKYPAPANPASSEPNTTPKEVSTRARERKISSEVMDQEFRQLEVETMK